MQPFRFRPRRPDEDYDVYELAFIGAWDAFCSRRRLSPFPDQPTGDRYLDACNASAEHAARPRWRALHRRLVRLSHHAREWLASRPHRHR